MSPRAIALVVSKSNDTLRTKITRQLTELARDENSGEREQ